MSVANFLTTAVLGLVIIAAIIIGFSWLFARLYTRPKRRLRTETPDDYDLPFESITFKSHGKKLDGWFIPADGNPIPRPAIIAAHGWSNNASQMLPVARQLHEAGFGVLLYDARGHGASGNDGPMTILKFAEDLIAGIDYLQERRDVDTTRLGVVGHSIGAASAILAASNEPRIRALVSSSAFADPTAITVDFMRCLHLPHRPFLWLILYFIERWLETTMAEVTPQNRISHITAPLLLIHGASDRFVPSSNMKALCMRAPQQQTRCWLVPGRRHSDVMLDPHFGTQVTDFLQKNLL